MSKLPAFRELQQFISEQTTRKPRQKSQSKPETANQLTRRIVAHIRTHGGFATRLQSTGQYRDDLKKFVPSQQVAGLPDVFGLIDGRALFVEVKTGRDVLSDQQQQTISRLQQAGAWVYVAHHNFAGFEKWFAAEFLTAPFA